MGKFLIEVSHEANTRECALAVKLLLETGSHFLTHSEWGCRDGEHKGWIIVEAVDKVGARNLLPPVYRAKAKIVQLNKFTLKEMNEILSYHQ